MNRWFRLAVALGSLVSAIFTFYAKPGLAVPVVALAMLLNLITGVGGVLIVRHDRTASGADDPATLNLLR
jgi:hypothetical protein